MSRQLSLFFATAGYVGLIPKAPGTCGSLLATIILFAVSRRTSYIPAELLLSGIGIVTVLGVLAADRVARDRGVDDPQMVVIDEVAGQLLTFLFIPLRWQTLLLGTILFRLFDIWKPFPLRRAESLPHGVGIMADDLLAGVYANLLLQGACRWLLA